MRKTENIINRTGINKTECKKTGHSKENKIPGVKCTPKIELYLSNFKGALHWWNGSLFFLIIILGITLGIFAGCKNIFVPEPPATPEAAGPGGGITVSLRLFTGSARSVMPEMESLIWEITATSGGAKATVLGEYPDFKISFPSKGEWTIKVKGKSGTESDAKEIFTGEKTMDITGSTVSISIPLSPGIGMTDGTGAIDLTMTVPTDVTKVMYKLDSDTEFTGLTPSNGSCRLNKTDVDARIHTLSLYFLDGNGMTVYMCTETVNVWSGVTSDQWIKTSGADYINGNGKFELTKGIIDNFLKTMGSVVYVDANVKDDEPATGSFFAPVNSVSKAVEILRKANGGKCNGTIMVDGETTIDQEIVVKNDESLTVKETGENASITNDKGRVFNITGGSVTLGDGITLTGTVTGENARGGAVYVTGGNFTMESGSTIADSSVQGTSASGGGVYVMNGTFIMEDGSKITGSSATVSGGGVAVSTGGTFTMRGGTIDGTGASSNAESGGGVEIHDAIFTMEGGTITGNNATYGGGVRVDSGEFIMKDGTISDNNATNLGGGVCVINGSFTMSDTATIQGNTATTHGGGVYVNGRNFEMIGGTIGGTDAGSANSAQYGGAVYVNGGNFTMEGNSVITGSYATGATAKGGAVYVNGGSFTMNGTATLKDNTATTHGGGVYIFSGGTFTMEEGSKITGGQAEYGGGVYVADGSFTMKGTATIQYNRAARHGGGVHILSGGTFTMNGGTIGGTIGGTAENTADFGGGVFVSGGTFDMNDGTISGNIVTQSGGGVHVNNGNFTMKGGTIGGPEAGSTNTAPYGGGVYVVDGTFTMTGGTISRNTATQKGGGVYVGDGTFTMSGGTISANNARMTGGGVFVSSSSTSFTLGPSSAESSPVISGNTKTDSTSNNVYLDGTILLIVGELKKPVDSGNIGISMATPGEFTLGWGSSGLADTTFFFSDDTERNVALSGSELSLNLVRVEGGSCTLNGQNVTLSSFWISPYEVTQEEFESIMTGNQNGIEPEPSYFQGEDRPPAEGEEKDRRPVDRVRWYEAIVYCNLLSIKEGLTPCYTINGSTAPADWSERPDSDVHDNYNVWNSVTCNFDDDGYRLPTEAEWEYAARGGNPKDSSWNNTYSGSDTLEDVAWYSNNSDSKTHEVGKKQANALGLYDMSGNVLEWCWDRKSEYADSRVLRGGSFNYAETKCTVSHQESNKPESLGSNQGFRVVRSIR